MPLPARPDSGQLATARPLDLLRAVSERVYRGDHVRGADPRCRGARGGAAALRSTIVATGERDERTLWRNVPRTGDVAARRGARRCPIDEHNAAASGVFLAYRPRCSRRALRRVTRQASAGRGSRDPRPRPDLQRRPRVCPHDAGVPAFASTWIGHGRPSPGCRRARIWRARSPRQGPRRPRLRDPREHALRRHHRRRAGPGRLRVILVGWLHDRALLADLAR